MTEYEFLIFLGVLLYLVRDFLRQPKCPDCLEKTDDSL